MADIFISYASPDRPTAERIANAFEALGWSVWWDRSIRSGTAFDRVIEEAINDAKTVVVLWSKNSVKSDWVRAEAAYALHEQKLVPASIDGAMPPLRYVHIQTLDISRWDGVAGSPNFDRLVRDLRFYIEGDQPVPASPEPAASTQAELEEETERQARQEMEELLHEAGERREREAAEQRAKAEAERLAREAAERQEKEAAEQRVKAEAERLAREAAERRENEAAEQRAKAEAERLARETVERREKEAAEQRAKAEAVRFAHETAERREQEAADRRAKQAAAERPATEPAPIDGADIPVGAQSSATGVARSRRRIAVATAVGIAGVVALGLAWMILRGQVDAEPGKTTAIHAQAAPDNTTTKQAAEPRIEAKPVAEALVERAPGTEPERKIDEAPPSRVEPPATPEPEPKAPDVAKPAVEDAPAQPVALAAVVPPPPSQPMPPPAPSVTAVAAAGHLALRAAKVHAEPDAAAEQIGTLAVNTLVTVTGRVSDRAWLRVAYGDKVGYVEQAALNPSPAPSAPRTGPPVAKKAPTGILPPRCRDITERVQLGEALTNADRAFLVASCNQR